jgi:hypothetical protein
MIIQNKTKQNKTLATNEFPISKPHDADIIALNAHLSA